jgi:hypothetical protein
MVCDFRSAKMNTGPPPKHDMFLCQFVMGPTLPMHGNPHWVALKRVMDLGLVIEIMLGGPRVGYP